MEEINKERYALIRILPAQQMTNMSRHFVRGAAVEHGTSFLKAMQHNFTLKLFIIQI